MLSKTVAKTLARNSFKLSKVLCFNFGQTLTLRQALGSAMADELRRDENVFLMGEEVAQYHGAYKVSNGLWEEFGDKRIIDTPITEVGFTALGVGAAYYGLRPIIEFMTFNFATQSFSQIINNAAKTAYMSAGDTYCPIVFRGSNGPSIAVAAQHSHCYASIYGTIPGLKVVSVWDCDDARGLLKSAVRDNNPVLVLESERMYGVEFECSDEVMDPEYLVNIGEARTHMEGSDVTIFSYAAAMTPTLQAAELLQKQGVNCEVINLRSIRPLDREAIVQSAMKTNRVVTVENGLPQSGIGAEIAGVLMETRAFDWLDAPMERVCGTDVPMPYAKNLEDLSTPQVENVVQAVNKVMMGVQ